MQNAWLLIGVVIVIIGFILKFDTIATVIIAGVVTGFVGGMDFKEILDVLGTAFLSQRFATLFVLTLPVIGILEKHGLREKATDFIGKFKNATTGTILTAYHSIRALSSAFSLRIGGHPTFVRPLVEPMAEAATVAKYGDDLDSKTLDNIKGQSAAAENYGNFFAQNVFVGASGTLLIAATLVEQGYTEVTPQNIAAWSIPIAIISVIIGAVVFFLNDRKIKQRMKKRGIRANETKGGAQ